MVASERIKLTSIGYQPIALSLSYEAMVGRLDNAPSSPGQKPGVHLDKTYSPYKMERVGNFEIPTLRLET